MESRYGHAAAQEEGAADSNVVPGVLRFAGGWDSVVEQHSPEKMQKVLDSNVDQITTVSRADFSKFSQWKEALIAYKLVFSGQEKPRENV